MASSTAATRWTSQIPSTTGCSKHQVLLHCCWTRATDLPGFFGPIGSRKRAPNMRGAHEKEPFTEEQMVTVLREVEKASVAEAAKKAQGQRAHHLRLVQALRLGGSCRCQTTKGTGDREQQAQEATGRVRSGHPDAQGDQRKKVVSPQARREQVALAYERSLSHRRACGLIGPVLRVSPAGQGHSRNSGHEDSVGTVPALRLSPYPDLPALPVTGVELVAHPPHLAPGGRSAAQEAPP